MRRAALTLAGKALAGLTLAGLIPNGAARADPQDWHLTPYAVNLSDDTQLTLGGQALGALHGGDQGGLGGALRLTPRIERDYDDGLVLALKATILAAHDRLSPGRYGGQVFEKLTGEMQTGLGRVKIGQDDGAARLLSLSGPKLDEAVSLDDPQMVFFRDPKTGRPLGADFMLTTALTASSNFAKLTYLSPALFGVQIGASFTPSEGREGIPFLHEGPQRADRQSAIWEAAIRYSASFGSLDLTAYGGFTEGHDERKTAGHAGLSEWALGTQADYNVNDDIKISLGGAFRRSNAYGFALGRVMAHGATQAAHLSARISDGPWLAGLEWGQGRSDAAPGQPDQPGLALYGDEASIGYVFNTNLQITAGWQQLRAARDSGVFFNGASRFKLEAGFLHLNFHV
jgi:hypothetical protein